MSAKRGTMRRSGRSEGKRDPELRALRENLVFEAVLAAAGFVVGINPTVAKLESSPFGELPVDVGKTQNGARLGDLFMSLIHTCWLCAANPLDYLNALQRHAKEAREHPTQWFPWNYKQAILPHDTG